MSNLSVLSLFTGAGGLDLGLEAAGFTNVGCVEVNSDARTTICKNRPNWNLLENGDILAHEPKDILNAFGIEKGNIRLIAGGPPCQPFSKAAYWISGDSGRLDDPRSKTLSAYLNLVREALPDVMLLENVKGLSYRGKDEGMQLLIDTLRDINITERVNYQPRIFHINASDYGVPQKRDRIFFIAAKGGNVLDLPLPTHGEGGNLSPRTTAWDAIWHLDQKTSCCPDVQVGGKWADLLPSVPEGENYQWHTAKGGGKSIFGWRTRYWTFLLKLAKKLPSWTLQAQPGTATGPFHWSNRRLTIEEMCRIQTFPNGYQICGSYNSARRQVGNAVPSAIGELIGLEIRRQLFGETVRNTLTLIPVHRQDCPDPEPFADLPSKYAEMIGVHPDHPGTGFGPGALMRKQNDGP